MFSCIVALVLACVLFYVSNVNLLCKKKKNIPQNCANDL